jgi:protocatechuate 3,4-dioxygenase beta subunit
MDRFRRSIPLFSCTRRKFLGRLAAGAAALSAPGAFAEELLRTPWQTEGPFYPNKLPLDTDNDLLIVNDSMTPAVGQITHLSGRILSPHGSPIRNALVEIWQVDANGVYLHTQSPRRDQWDTNFQGFGRFMTGSTGEYYFRTIKPVAYGEGRMGRTPHIHFAVHLKGREPFTTQLYVQGEPRNETDFLLNEVKDPAARAAIVREFASVEGSRVGELAAQFDIVMGFTPQA